jgi:hypothetical protein
MSQELDCIYIETPFFNTTLVGGFSTVEFSTTTLPGIDGPFALLLSHVCCAELCVNAIRRNITVSLSLFSLIDFV